MSIAVSKSGIGILYRCYNLKYRYSIFKTCPDEDTDKCTTCKYAKAELSAYDATRLVNGFMDTVNNKAEVGRLVEDRDFWKAKAMEFKREIGRLKKDDDV